jgi:hypothetical protein
MARPVLIFLKGVAKKRPKLLHLFSILQKALRLGDLMSVKITNNNIALAEVINIFNRSYSSCFFVYTEAKNYSVVRFCVKNFP